ncbi:hypothetical protein HK103_003006 [Boothiomyces macroporosus]|uniref:GH26 domain-containing protein n=1 Tax=Boothiomyces macroporosus TaxID=261099 RepID=A0AAD5UJH1_9FUNG|nr:hypothetical protein HK103_003006 [Boothiomyces macroporosus]
MRGNPSNFKAEELAPLEPEDGVYLGSWWQDPDTPSRTNERVIENNVGDTDIGATIDTSALDRIFSGIDDTNTDAILYLTLYPKDGMDAVSEDALDTLCKYVGYATHAGRRVFIRYASEMNGYWFGYSRQPKKFIEGWIRFAKAVRKVSKDGYLALIWAPNSPNGYPWPSSPLYLNDGKEISYQDTFRMDPSLDSNGDGLWDYKDDPFTPYYPGDEWVDWLYHYGREYPWETNDIPTQGWFEDVMIGREKTTFGRYNFYEMFSGNGSGGSPHSKSTGGKPFMVSETGAAVHLYVSKPGGNAVLPQRSDPESRMKIKQAWWRQFFNSTFLELYPKFKSICFFEYIKYEETTWRDFTTLGQGTNIQSPFGNDGGAKDDLVLEAFKQDMSGPLGKKVVWANDAMINSLGHAAKFKHASNLTGAYEYSPAKTHKSVSLSLLIAAILQLLV